MNCVIDPMLDRSSHKNVAPSRMARTLSSFMEQNGYIDPWRFLNPSTKQYSFLSYVHRTYSRIDYFLIDKTLTPYIVSAEYSPIAVSDHSSVILDIRFELKHKSFRSWRLDPLLLSDAAFRNHISDAIDFFLETNQSDDTSPTLLWETLKAFIRGKIISYTAHINRCRRTRHKELEDALANLDTQHSTNQSPDLYKERLKLQTELDLLSTREAEQLLLQSRGTFYESGDRAGRLLAQQLKSRNASNQIAQIRNDTGMITSDPGEISDIFREFYSQLYSSESPDDGAHFFHNFLQS